MRFYRSIKQVFSSPPLSSPFAMFSAAVLALAASSSVLAAPSVSISFSGAKSVVDVDNFKVVATIKNTGDEALNLLNDPNSLLTPKWATNVFSISNSKGSVPAFKGAVVKYSPEIAAADKAYTTIAVGQSVQLEHTLGGVYNFTSAGSYIVTPSSLGQTFTHVNAAGELTTLVADVADFHAAKVSGKITPSKFVAPTVPALSKRAHSFTGCTAARQTLLNTAAVNAQTYADGAVSYLTSHTATSTRYTTWFGTWTAARRTTVLSHYTNIANGQLATDSFDCTCTESGTYAYVYPDTFGYIYLCGAFWSAPATGTDSKAGTLIHESSHFTRNGGTDDHVYGQTNAKALAKSSPAQAVDNADNHEYFAENTPALA